MNPDLLKLVQWLSPAFPTGAYAYSSGLEYAISEGTVSDRASLEVWLLSMLQRGTGWQDAVILAQTLKADIAPRDLSDYAYALSSSAERYQETHDLGRAFAAGVAALGIEIADDAALPVAVGQAAWCLDLDDRDVTAMYLHALAANLVSAAVRFVPLGQNAGQQVLAALHSDIAQIAVRACQANLDDATSATLGADMAAIKHETMDVRIFRT